jgi:hypothetical protein
MHYGYTADSSRGAEVVELCSPETIEQMPCNSDDDEDMPFIGHVEVMKSAYSVHAHLSVFL